VNFFRRFRDGVLVAVLIVIPFFFLEANLSDPTTTSWLDKLILKASAPIQYLATQVAHGVSSVVEEYVFLVDVERDNEQVRQDNARLRQTVRELRGEARENQRLRELLELREQIDGETLSAQVIGKEVSQYFRVIRTSLDRGERDFVPYGMTVVSPAGLVGQLRRTWDGRYSDVLLAVDRTSAIDVVVGDSGARGMLRGTGEDYRYLSRIQYLKRSDEVEVGDEVFTSGLGRRFPPSILVGRVITVGKQDFGLYQEVEVAPTVDFSKLQEVLILTAGSREQSAAEGLRREDQRGADER